MHTSVYQWVSAVLPAADVAGRYVLEVGAYNVNGSVRQMVEAHGPASYIGVDQTAGPGVDQVVLCAALVATFGPGRFDVVVSTEMLEHTVDWPDCVAQMCDVVRPGGILVVTTRSVGFPYHPFPIDTWRFSVAAMREIVARAGFVVDDLVDDPDRRSPGVFCRASKPLGWASPWAKSTAARVFGDVPGVTAVVAP